MILSRFTARLALPPAGKAYVVYAVFVGLILLGLIYIWVFFDPPFGDSMKNLITYALEILFFVGSAMWSIALAPTTWPRRVALAAVFLSPIAVTAAIVRDVEWSGDMKMTWHYRWDAPDSAARRAAVVPPEETAIDFTVVPASSDYLEYRGPARDGVIESTNADFTSDANEIWRVEVGAGWAGMAVVGPLLVTLEQIDADEAIVCYSADTGAELWRNTYSASFDEAMGGPGPRSTPTIKDGQVFTMGAMGYLTCVDLYTGDTKWQVNTFELFGISNLTWATSGSPLVRGERVYINTGSTQDGGLTCFDRTSGEVVWRASDEAWNKKGDNAAGYASPMLAVVAGIEQLLMFDGKALRGHAIEDGRTLWSHPFSNDALVNVAQPIVFDDGRIFIAASYGIGCEMVKVSAVDDAWNVDSVWKEPRLMRCKFTSPVERGGYIYGLDEGVLECLNAETGQRMWKKGRFGHGQILLDDNLILVMTEDGRFVVVNANPGKLEVVNEFDVFDAARNWNPHSVSRGRLFLRNHRAHVQFDHRRVARLRRVAIEPHALFLGVHLHQLHLFLGTAREPQVVQGRLVEREDATGGPILRRHIRNGRPIRQGQVGQARPHEFDELSRPPHDLAGFPQCAAPGPWRWIPPPGFRSSARPPPRVSTWKPAGPTWPPQLQCPPRPNPKPPNH